MTMMDAGISFPADLAAKALWHQVEEGFWVGNADGVFLGTIEQHAEDRFFARNATRAYVGEYRTVDTAIDAVMAHFG